MKKIFLNIYKMELYLRFGESWDSITYEKYEERRISDYESEKKTIADLKDEIKWNEKMIEFQKAFLKRGKELFANEVIDEVIDEDYQKFEENEIMIIKKQIQEREIKIKEKRKSLKRHEERVNFKKIFLKRGEEVFKKIFTD